jgi:L-iditol 2-dehydrogenase
VLIQRGEDPKDSSARIKDAAQGALKLAMDCTGVESSVQTAIYVSWLAAHSL